MAYEQASGILERMAAAADARGCASIMPVIANTIGAELVDVEPFVTWKDRELNVDPWGGRFPFWQSIGRWAAAQLDTGLSPQAIIDLGLEMMAKDRLEVLAVFAIEGVSVKKIVPFCEGAWLVPMNEVPASWARDHMFPTGQLGNSIAYYRDVRHTNVPRCALVVEEIIKPLTSAEKTDGQLKTFVPGNGVAEDIARALGLTTDSWMALPSRYCIIARQAFGADFTGVRSYAYEIPPRVSAPPDIKMARRIYQEIERFAHRDKLRLAIDRLVRSRTEFSHVDKAIDLGLAAEVLLMHDAQPSNTEIRHKVGLRSGWLLGTSPEDRKIQADAMRKLYDARSSAAHSATLGKTKFDPAAADDLVAKLINRVLEVGHLPAWDDLTMGMKPGKKWKAKAPSKLARAPGWPV